MVPVQVHGVAVMPPETAPVMLLREQGGEQRWLAIVIGAPEAQVLLAAQEHVVQARPSTIELIGHVFEAFGTRLAEVEVTGLHDGIFVSDLVLDTGERISARPSDAVALALRAGAPVSVAETVLAQASVEVEEVRDVNAESDEDEDPESEATREQEIADFRALLDEMSPDDFGDPPAR